MTQAVRARQRPSSLTLPCQPALPRQRNALQLRRQRLSRDLQTLAALPAVSLETASALRIAVADAAWPSLWNATARLPELDPVGSTGRPLAPLRRRFKDLLRPETVISSLR